MPGPTDALILAPEVARASNLSFFAPWLGRRRSCQRVHDTGMSGVWYHQPHLSWVLGRGFQNIENMESLGPIIGFGGSHAALPPLISGIPVGDSAAKGSKLRLPERDPKPKAWRVDPIHSRAKTIACGPRPYPCYWLSCLGSKVRLP